MPAPVALPDGSTVADTSAGPATLCEWIPGVRPDISQEPALEGFGRAAAQLSAALADVAPGDTPNGWQGNPLGAAGLPTQVVHADLAASNVLVSPDTRAVTGVLDFEMTGCWIRALELTVALALSGAVPGPGWPRRAAAVVRGGAWGQRLTAAELAALPELILVRAMVSTLWRADRWRRGLSSLTEVADRLDVLTETLRWRATDGGELADIAAAGRPGHRRAT